ncbi:MAG: hypothetical protein KAT43_02845 [Nanoarchaeota archaeon]|nr:hypothetical protein [Nanoarchaeota archaeon]
MDTKILEEIGLTQSEIKVFLALNKLGSARAVDIIEKSGLQSPVVHRAFHSLAEKGLITSMEIGKIKEYQAVKPERLLNIVEERKEKLLKIIPELKQQSEFAKHKPEARIYKGVKAIRELWNYMLEDTKEIFGYGGAQKSVELLGEFFWDGFHKKRTSKKISIKMVFHQSLKSRVKELNKLKLTEVKLTRNDFEELVETVISGNKVAIIIYSDSPYGFLLEEQKAVKSYSKFFELIWNQATMIK